MSVATKLRGAVDGVMDAIVLSLALWTLLYCLGLATQWSLWPSGWLWLAATVLLLAWRVAAELRDLPLAEDEPLVEEVAQRPSRNQGALLYAGVALAVIGAVAGLFWSKSAFPVSWAAACLAVALLTVWIWLRVRATAGDEPTGAPEPRPFDGGLWAHLGVLAISAGLAVGALFIHLEDSDDTYYVNRSVWVAEHGNAAIKDTMFGAEEFISPYGGGIPIASIEAQIGVVAHMLGIRAGTATYLIAGPVFSLLAGWAIWRLVRAWAPRRVFLVYVLAIGFLMLSGDSMMGNFWIVRMWQGKVMAICFLMPLIWAYVTDVIEARSTSAADAPRGRAGWWPIFMLLAAGTAFFGLTPTAVVWGPLMAGAILVAAILVRSRQLAVAAGALAVGPVLSGIAVIVFSSDVGGKDPAKETLTAYESFVRVLGETNPIVAISLLGLALAPLLVRIGTPALVAGCSALASMAIFAPGVLPLANAVTGSGPILWRMLFCAPIPVLVALLASAPAPAWLPRGRVVPILAGVALLAGLALGGRPIWAYTGHGGPVWVDTRPQWKLNVPARNDVALLVDEGLRGDVLLPPRQMKALTMYSTQAFPIVPRHWFIENIGEEQAKSDARNLLFRVAEGDNRNPSVPAVRRSLRLLDVDVACVGSGPDGPRILAVYKRAGYGDERSYGTLRCVTPQR